MDDNVTLTPSQTPVVVTLTMFTSVSMPTLMDMRRDLISALQTVENLLGLPPEKRAIRTRAERRGIDNISEVVVK